jgi:hypothetical protein
MLTKDDMMVGEFAKRHPALQFNHVFPGLVSTPLPNKLPFPIPQFAWLFSFLMTNGMSAGFGI